MNKKLIKLASELLENHSDVLSNRSCNDWDFPEDWTLEEKQAMVKEIAELNGNLKEYDPQMLYLSDWQVASFLSSKLKELIND